MKTHGSKQNVSAFCSTLIAESFADALDEVHVE